MPEYVPSQCSHRGPDESIVPSMLTESRPLLLSIVHDFDIAPSLPVFEELQGRPELPDRGKIYGAIYCTFRTKAVDLFGRLNWQQQGGMEGRAVISKCLAAIREFVAPRYRPELHYMRGPGPACARRRS